MTKLSKTSAHLQQANSNLEWLQATNGLQADRYDWQVTTAFYAALHVVNAYVAAHQMSYRSHYDIKNALNPKAGGPIAISQPAYNDYQALFRLSRRARYLIDTSISDQHHIAHTSEKHFVKAVRRLDKLLVYFQGQIDDFTPLDISLISDRLASGDALTFCRAKSRK